MWLKSRLIAEVRLMAKIVKQGTAKKLLNGEVKKGTSIGGGKTKVSSMNKSKRSSYKKYRGQGR
jgi:hypothetical protein